MKEQTKKREEFYNILRQYPEGLTERELTEIVGGYRNTGSRLLELTEKYRGNHALVIKSGKRKSTDSNKDIHIYKAINPEKEYYEYYRVDLKDLEKIFYCLRKINEPTFKIEQNKRIVFNEILFKVLNAKNNLMDVMKWDSFDNFTITYKDQSFNCDKMIENIYKEVKNAAD